MKTTLAAEKSGCDSTRGDALRAVRCGDHRMLLSSLHAGAPVNLCDGKGNTLLMLASHHGHAEAVRILLERGADPDRQNLRHQTPLGGVAFKGNLEIAKLLVESGADPAADQGGGRLPIQYAAISGHAGMVRYLESVTRRPSLGLRVLSRFTARLRLAFRGHCRCSLRHYMFVAGV